MERQTRQREAIQFALEQAGRPLTPQELLSLAQTHVPGIGMATVYRNLKVLLSAGEIIEVPLPGEASRYELAGHHHHHHFYCSTCDRLFEVEGCPGNMTSLAPSGFQVQSHELTLYGVCLDCSTH